MEREETSYAIDCFEERILKITRIIILSVLSFNSITFLFMVIQSFAFLFSVDMAFQFFFSFYIIFVIGYIIALILSYRPYQRTKTSILMLLLLNLQVLYLSLYLPRGSQVYLAFFLLPILSYFMFPPSYRMIRTGMTLLPILLFYYSAGMDLLVDSTWAPLALSNFFIISTFLFFLKILIVHHFYQATYLAEQSFFEENQRAEGLLLNTLPKNIAQRLKSGEESISESYQDVSILFADLVGFTELSMEFPPEEIVRYLNTIYYAFDEKCKELELEKIKTFGDGYMVMGGGLNPHPQHLEHILELGAFMLSYIEDFNERMSMSLKIRIGVHVGPVIAGVIGKIKFSYDLWGDTVNLASRMESEGLPMCIQVTEEVNERVNGHYPLERRGEIQVKGRGMVTTYLISCQSSSTLRE